MNTWTHVDKSKWGDGPWQKEPDKAYWVDPETDLDCLIVRNPILGQLCGYVGVPKDHPFYKKGYDDCDVDVHGGLTFANFCQKTKDEAHGICHKPDKGRPKKVWWLGFDCGHCYDAIPGAAAQYREMTGLCSKAFGLDDTNIYRDFSYVEGQVKKLAMQVKDAEVS